MYNIDILTNNTGAHMKRLLLATTLGLTTLAANATCPTSIVGKYVGHGQYIEQKAIHGISVISYMESQIMSITVTSTHMTAIGAFFASTGSGLPAQRDVTGSTLYIFDKNSCMGQMGGNSDPLYFVVSDNGNQLNFIHGKSPVDPHLAMETWELRKQ
jgi:hypothetical protein